MGNYQMESTPQFEKCFACIPLRIGVLVWGYLKVLIPVISLVLVLSGAVCHGPKWFIGILLFAFIMDAVFNIALVVGAHKKYCILLRMYYFYSIVTFVALAVLSVCFLAYIIQMLIECDSCLSSELVYTGALVVTVLDCVLQSYLTLLVRSLITKINNDKAKRAAYANSAKELRDFGNYDKVSHYGY